MPSHQPSARQYALQLGGLINTQCSTLCRYATSWGDADITCVSPAWVDASAAAGVAVPPHDFPPPVPRAVAAARCGCPATSACAVMTVCLGMLLSAVCSEIIA